MKKMQTLRAVPIRLGEAFQPENNIVERVQLLRTGNFNHPEYGPFVITNEILSSMVKNFSENVRRVDLAIDYAHESDKKAAAWIQSVELNEIDGITELWATVKWTPTGKQILLDKEYRYLSADFTMDYEDTETLQKFGPTLFGAGLTNRPYVKDMAPAIELSEGRENPTMDPKDKQIADQQAQIEALKKQIEELKAAGGVEAGEADKKALEDAKKALADSEAKNKELQDKVAVGEKEKVLAEKNAKFAELMKAGKAVAAQKDAFIEGDAIKFAELAQPVKLNSAGNGETVNETAKDKSEAEQKLLSLANEKIKTDKSLTLGEAVSIARKENPELVKLCS